MSNSVKLKTINPVLNITGKPEEPKLELLGIRSAKNKQLRINVEAALISTGD